MYMFDTYADNLSSSHKIGVWLHGGGLYEVRFSEVMSIAACSYHLTRAEREMSATTYLSGMFKPIAGCRSIC